MKYLNSIAVGCKELGIEKYEFVAKTQFFSTPILTPNQLEHYFGILDGIIFKKTSSLGALIPTLLRQFFGLSHLLKKNYIGLPTKNEIEKTTRNSLNMMIPRLNQAVGHLEYKKTSSTHYVESCLKN